MVKLELLEKRKQKFDKKAESVFAIMGSLWACNIDKKFAIQMSDGECCVYDCLSSVSSKYVIMFVTC